MDADVFIRSCGGFAGVLAATRRSPCKNSYRICFGNCAEQAFFRARPLRGARARELAATIPGPPPRPAGRNALRATAALASVGRSKDRELLRCRAVLRSHPTAARFSPLHNHTPQRPCVHRIAWESGYSRASERTPRLPGPVTWLSGWSRRCASAHQELSLRRATDRWGVVGRLTFRQGGSTV